MRLQLDSILGQTSVETFILTSDDMSTDATMEIIYDTIPEDRLSGSENVTRNGLPENFLNLMRNIPQGYEMYAFSDQDDVWKADKLHRAWLAFQTFPSEQPVLWLSAVQLVGPEGSGHKVHPHKTQYPSFGNALVDSIGPGCAMVWNRALQDRLHVPRSDECLMHDTWLYLSAAALGNVVWDPSPSIQYRLHSENYGGIDNRLTSRVRRQLSASRGLSTSVEKQASAFLKYYGTELDVNDFSATNILANGSRWQKFRGWSQRKYSRQYTKDNILLGLRFLLFS